MKKRRLIIVFTFVIFVGLALLCAVAYMKVLKVPREKHLVTIELPSGDRIIIKFCYRDLQAALFQTSGRLKYDIYSGQFHRSGQLTAASYDLPEDVRLTHEIQGARRVKIEEGRRQSIWIFEGDSSGQYKVRALPSQKRN